MPDVDDELAGALRQAKTKSMFFVFVAKSNGGKLLVDKNKISPKDAAAARKECGGGTIFRGRCRGEGAMMLFEVGVKVPETLADQTKKVIKKNAGLTLEVEYRFAADLTTEANELESTGEESESTDETAPLPPSPTKETNPAATRFASRLKALLPVVRKIEEVNPVTASHAKRQIAEGNKAYLAKDHLEANAALDRAETLIKQGLASVGKGTTPQVASESPAPVHDADPIKRLNGLTGAIKAALPGPFAGSVQTLLAKVNAAIKDKDFSRTGALLDEFETLLAKSADTPGGLSVMKLGKARVEWIATRLEAVKEIKRLQAAIAKEFETSEQQKTALANALKQLDGLVGKLNEDLDDQLDAVLNAPQEGRQALAETAKKTMTRFVGLVEADEIMLELDENEVLPDMKVVEPLRLKLKEIAAALG